MPISTEQASRMLIRAIQAHGFGIRPCAGRKFSQCYTVVGNMAVFWYNDASGSTRVVQEPLEPGRSPAPTSEAPGF